MSAQSENGHPPPATRQKPQSGEEYLESLRDGRDIIIHNEKVHDPTNHIAFRNAARMIARLYDALHNPKKRDPLTAPTGPNSYTQISFVPATTTDDLVRRRNATATWARTTYGWMGQTPDEGAGVILTLKSLSNTLGKCSEPAIAWYKKASEAALYIHHAIRDEAAILADPRETPIHVEKENDQGLIISGTTVVPASVAISAGVFILKDSVMPTQGEESPLAFFAPMNTKGVRLLYRPSSTAAARLYGNPFDYPLTSRLEENQALLILDQALIPWENLFCYRKTGCLELHSFRAQFAARTSFQECTRLAVKLELIIGLLLRSIEAAGTANAPEAKAAVGEILAYRNLFYGMSEAQARLPFELPDQSLLPNPEQGLAYRIFSSLAYPKIRDIIENTVGSGHVYLSATAADFMNPETRAYLDRFVRGENGYSALDRVKLTKLLWDALGTEMGAQSHAESKGKTPGEMRIDALTAATETGLVDQCKRFAGECLDEYDIEGWRAKDLQTPIEMPPAISSRRRTTMW